MSKQLAFWIAKSHLINEYLLTLTYDSYGLKRDLEILENLAHGMHDEMIKKAMLQGQFNFSNYFTISYFLKKISIVMKKLSVNLT
ncbi:MULTISPECIES: hypothetical protein [Priestia]|uniref:hypothetical protein n=1 Tax=Priestia TaxID=2800373 RepID=UPI001C8D235D|nr:hypothetical protein [Priestia aryabhattai]MBY0210627.1 hypothetical protein [Priestia aryabhattai]